MTTIASARSRLDRVQAALEHVEVLAAWEGDARVTLDLAVAHAALRRAEKFLCADLASAEVERTCETVTPEGT